MKNKKLKFLKMDIINHPLFKEEISFSLVASQKILNDEHDDMTNLYGSIWTNNITTLIGRNASGKTLTMKLIMGMLDLLLHQRSIEQTHLKEALIGIKPITFKTYFYGSDHFLYLDELTVAPETGQENRWVISSEKILEKKFLKSHTRKSIFDFSKSTVFMDRNQLDPLQSSLLAPDDSFIRTLINQKQYETQRIQDTLLYTNTNFPFFRTREDQIPSAILRYLDPTIEYLFIEQKEDSKSFYRLKFKNSSEEITDSNFATIEYYLSSGTVKGITLYQYVLNALRSGGIIFIDELENHFNLSIVHTFLEYFMDPIINQNHATLIFSTHYADLINDLNRGDQIFVARRDTGKISIDRYSEIADRQDINRAEVFMSNYLGGTAPDYDTYIELRNQTIDLTKPKDKNMGIADGK
ncbi:ATP-binding protein [Pediococcus stilesii]|uniref:ATP-binding protein n=1 Tax=Pediococcus stilesii TaxID=331679 RepID=A0A5R9BTD3_9LACO|nr:AAA family ATPase [Pediococcus stilesii]TLQ03473.1 ATP-binding protein [Pediococcus stilesii]